MNKRYIAAFVSVSMLATALSAASPALAQSVQGAQEAHQGWFASLVAKIKGVFGHREELSAGKLAFGWGISGTVSAVNGSTVTVNASSTAYTVDASQAKVYKGSATTTVSVADIAVGDTVTVKGKVDGTSVSAALIIDGVKGFDGRFGMPFEGFASSTRRFMASTTRPFMKGGEDGAWQGARGPQGPMGDRGQRPGDDR